MEKDLGATKVEEKLFEIAAKNQVPIYGGFELTPYCNLACKMCYVKETAPGLPVLGAKEWLDLGRQAAEMGTLIMQLTGGEPMLHPEFRTIYAGLKALGLVLTMNTNATLIDEAMADFLAANMPRRVNVTLYGPSREVYAQLCGHGEAFDRTIRAIELMLERRIPVKINLTPTTINFPYWDEMLAICRRYGLVAEMTPYLFEPLRKTCPGRQQYRLDAQNTAIAVEKCDRYRYNEEQMKAYAVLAHRGLPHFEESRRTTELMPLSCRAATSSFWLCWDGRMNACVNMTQPRADVRTLGFVGAWERVKEYGKTIRMPAKCATCSLRMLCMPCAAVCLHENGTFEQVPQIMCDATEAYARNLAKTVNLTEKKETEETR